MAREKKGFFEWLTGSQDERELTFDDLESGTAFPGTRPAVQNSRVSPPQTGETYIHHQAIENAPAAPEPEGELAVDLYQTPTHIVIKAMIAGVRPEDLDVSISRDMVTIRGKREQLVEGNTGAFVFKELYWGSFSRTTMLPVEVDIEGAEAIEKHGLLMIRLPKLDKGRQAKLKVRSN